MADANIAVTQVTIAGITVAAINYLKNATWFPWLTQQSTKLARLASALVAAAAAVGVTYTWNPESHTLTIVGLTLPAIAAAAWAWLKQMTLNELVFQTTKPKSAPVVVQAAQQAAIPSNPEK